MISAIVSRLSRSSSSCGKVDVVSNRADFLQRFGLRDGTTWRDLFDPTAPLEPAPDGGALSAEAQCLVSIDFAQPPDAVVELVDLCHF